MKQIEINGLNIDRLIDLMLVNGITPQNLTRLAHDKLVIQISNKEYKKLVDLKLLTCYNISVLKSTPNHPLAVMLVKRLALFVGVLVSILVLNITSSKIWDINISIVGEDYSGVEEKIKETIASKGIGVGQPFNYSTRELERELVALIDESASVVITRTGTSLDIEVKMRVLKPEQANTDIVAAYDGKVTKISHSSGILTVNIGEGVSKGQVLIASGAQGDFYAEAIGEIHAKVLISGSAVGSKKTDVVRRSGQMTEVEMFEIFGKQIYLNRDKKDVTSIYKNYEVERQEVFIAYNNCLPIKKVILKVYELTTDEVERDKDIVIEELKDQAYKTAKANLPNGAVEGAVSFDIFEDNGFYKVVCNIETEISIGIRK